MRNQDDLDDFHDSSTPPLTDWVELVLQWIFITAGTAMFFYVGRLLLETLWR